METGWKDKVNRTKYHEGYGDVSYEDVWNLDVRLAGIIANHLRAFLKAMKGPNGGCPSFFTDGGRTFEEGHQMWLNIIRKMIFAFEEYHNCTGGCDYDMLPDEKKERINEGMQLFIDYYRCLWI